MGRARVEKIVMIERGKEKAFVEIFPKQNGQIACDFSPERKTIRRGKLLELSETLKELSVHSFTSVNSLAST